MPVVTVMVLMLRGMAVIAVMMRMLAGMPVVAVMVLVLALVPVTVMAGCCGNGGEAERKGGTRRNGEES